MSSPAPDSKQESEAKVELELEDHLDHGIGHLTPPELHTCSLCSFTHSQEDGLLQHIRQEHIAGEPSTAANSTHKHDDLLHTHVTGRQWVWSPDEVEAFLKLWASQNIQKQLQKSTRNHHIFIQLSSELTNLGFDKPPEQCRRKIKKLKEDYKRIKSQGGPKPRDKNRFVIMDSVLKNQSTGDVSVETDAEFKPVESSQPASPSCLQFDKSGVSGIGHLTPPELHTCSLCSFTHSQEDGLLQHIRQEHIAGEPSTAADSAHKQDDLLHTHVTGEHPFICTHCGRGFRLYNTLQTHERWHKNKKCYTCHICVRTFIHQSSHKRHMLMHKGEKNYLCTECGKAFLASGELTLHTRTHTGERPFTCKLCGKGFIVTCDLRVHMRTHTGEKPYVCTRCPKAFTARKYLKRHMFTHNDKKPFECFKCNKGFVESYYWKKHMLASKCINY